MMDDQDSRCADCGAPVPPGAGVCLACGATVRGGASPEVPRSAVGRAVVGGGTVRAEQPYPLPERPAAATYRAGEFATSTEDDRPMSGDVADEPADAPSSPAGPGSAPSGRTIPPDWAPPAARESRLQRDETPEGWALGRYAPRPGSEGGAPADAEQPSYGWSAFAESRRPESGEPSDSGAPPSDSGAFAAPPSDTRAFGAWPSDPGAVGTPPPDSGAFGAPPYDSGAFPAPSDSGAFPPSAHPEKPRLPVRTPRIPDPAGPPDPEPWPDAEPRWPSADGSEVAAAPPARHGTGAPHDTGEPVPRDTDLPPSAMPAGQDTDNPWDREPAWDRPAGPPSWGVAADPDVDAPAATGALSAPGIGVGRASVRVGDQPPLTAEEIADALANAPRRGPNTYQSHGTGEPDPAEPPRPHEPPEPVEPPEPHEPPEPVEPPEPHEPPRRPEPEPEPPYRPEPGPFPVPGPPQPPGPPLPEPPEPGPHPTPSPDPAPPFPPVPPAPVPPGPGPGPAPMPFPPPPRGAVRMGATAGRPEVPAGPERAEMPAGPGRAEMPAGRAALPPPAWPPTPDQRDRYEFRAAGAPAGAGTPVSGPSGGEERRDRTDDDSDLPMWARTPGGSSTPAWARTPDEDPSTQPWARSSGEQPSAPPWARTSGESRSAGYGAAPTGRASVPPGPAQDESARTRPAQPSWREMVEPGSGPAAGQPQSGPPQHGAAPTSGGSYGRAAPGAHAQGAPGAHSPGAPTGAYGGQQGPSGYGPQGPGGYGGQQGPGGYGQGGTYGGQRAPGGMYGGPGTSVGDRPGGYSGTPDYGTFSGPLETSGSLTGHILSQGNPDQDGPRPTTTKVMIWMLVVLGILVISGLTLAIVAGDSLTSLLGSLFKG